MRGFPDPSAPGAYIPEAFHRRYDDIQSDTLLPRRLRRRDELFHAMAVAAWEEDPAAQLGVIPTKFLKTWALPAHFDIYTADTTFTPGLQLARHFRAEGWPWYAPYKHAFFTLIHWGVLAGAAAGLVVGLGGGASSARRYCGLMVALVATMSFLYAVPFYGLPRFHAPLLPLVSTLWRFLVRPSDRSPTLLPS